MQQGHRPVVDLFQALWEHLPHRPALLQAGDRGGLRPVHRRDVRQRAVPAHRREAAAEDQLGGENPQRKRRTFSHDTSLHVGAADGRATGVWAASVPEVRTAQPECKNRDGAL